MIEIGVRALIGAVEGTDELPGYGGRSGRRETGGKIVLAELHPDGGVFMWRPLDESRGIVATVDVRRAYLTGASRSSCCRGTASLPSSSLFVEPDVFHTPAIEDAVDHDRVSLDIRLPAGRSYPAIRARSGRSSGRPRTPSAPVAALPRPRAGRAML